MPDLRAEIRNLNVRGETVSKEYLESGKAWRYNHIRLQLSGKTIDLYQRPIVFSGQNLLAGPVHTTTLFVRNVQAKEERKAERIVIDLCHLLSFATMSEVRVYEFGYGGLSNRWRSGGRISQWRPPIQSNGEQIADFVRKTWRRFRVLKGARRLPELIHYLTLADDTAHPLEIRMLLVFVALENMKGTWAKSSAIPYRNGKFWKTEIRKGTPTQVQYVFESLLNDMFAEVKMSPSLRRIVRIRNQIVHFGLTNRKPQVNETYCHRAKALEHEYLLRLLGYTGPFLDYLTVKTRELRRLYVR